MGNISLKAIFIILLFVDVTFCQDCWKDERTPISKYKTTNERKLIPYSFKCYGATHQRTAAATCTMNHCYIDYEVTKKPVCCEGYYTSGKDCIPVCKQGCQNGRCTTPETCSCNEGYLMANGRCTPQCTSCSNGNCIAPDQCICLEGFEKNNAGLCVPKCKDDCINGICNEFNECVCQNGFYFNKKLLDFGIKNNTVCTAKCDQPCSKGICSGRNRCECYVGYELHWTTMVF